MPTTEANQFNAIGRSLVIGQIRGTKVFNFISEEWMAILGFMLSQPNKKNTHKKNDKQKHIFRKWKVSLWKLTWWFFILCRDFRPTSLERNQEKMRLRIYKVYAFGIPLLISTLAATLDHMRKNSLAQDAYLQPRFCESEYWFSGQYYF